MARCGQRKRLKALKALDINRKAAEYAEVLNKSSVLLTANIFAGRDDLGRPCLRLVAAKAASVNSVTM
jgi:hypothetical protein